jgi:ParB family chromosome partitioning protein
MTASQLIKINISDILEGKRLRDVVPEDAQKLSLSLGESGRLIQPITVRPSKKQPSKYDLIIGGHRVAAAKILGWEEIDVISADLSDDDAELLEVDENLYRTDLTQCDLTFFMKKRLELFNFNGGKLKRGRDLRKSANLADLNPREEDRYYGEIEAKFGIKRRTAERLVRRARNIPEALWPKIKGTKAALNGALLDKIAELQPEQRQEIVRLMDDVEIKLADAIKRVSHVVPSDPDAAELSAFVKAWKNPVAKGHRKARSSVEAWFKANGDVT